MKTLAAAIARQHVEEDGLRALYLPDQLPHLARQVVLQANAARPSETPFSILVSDDLPEDLSDCECPVVGMGLSIQYRRDDRLAVVCGAHSVPASFSSSFGAAVESDYPGEDGNARTEQLTALAKDALDIILAQAGVNADFVDSAVGADRLASIFATLAGAYERIAQGGDAWNVYWFRHVGSGLDALTEVFGQDLEGDDDETADVRLARLSYPSFGLPTPSSGTSYGLSRRVDEALMEFWSTSENIELTLKRLRHHPSRLAADQGMPHELEKLSFSNFGQTVAATDNVLLAWGTPQGPVGRWVNAFSALSEAEFFAPQQGLDSALKVCADDGSKLDIAGQGSPQIVVFQWDDQAKQLTSETLRVSVPTFHIPGQHDVSRSRLTLSVSGSGVGKAIWVGTLGLEAGALIAEGSIVLPRPGPARMQARPISLSTAFPADDTLAGCVGSAVSSSIYPVVEGTVGVWTFEGKGTKDAFKPGVYRGYETVAQATEDAGIVVPVESSVGTVVRTVTWGEAPTAAFTVREFRRERSDLCIRMSEPDLVTTSEDELSVGSLMIRWRTGTRTDEFLSPLLAAARKGVVSAGEPDVEVQHSFRGRVETYYARFIDEATTLDALGHLAMFEDQADVPDALEVAAGGAVLVPEGRRALFSSHIGFQVSADFRASTEASRFQQAIAGLGLATHLRRPGDAGDRADVVWPSRTSWAWAHGSAALDEYLDAYACLIDRASSGTPQDVFWASFPFSVSLYRSDGTKKARAVMLSPFHPLRLAWLAAAEDSLRQTAAAERLAGVLEAWNLPIVGPQADSHNGRLLAVPVDAGTGQLFLGWSMLVAASVAGNEALESPSQVGALPAPGTSVTGLNADAVRTALRTFHRMNPQVSTLSIDLASSTPTPRLGEIDQAIIEAIAAPPGKSGLRGGVRVHDSMNRLGEAPLAELERALGVSPARPVRWSRYKHQQTGGPHANMRFLQDAGVKVEVSPTQTRGSGRISTVPLRRFATPSEAGVGHAALDFPVIDLQPERSAFVRALAKLERSDQGVQISAELFQAALVNDSADWTVTGESLVGANALADMLAAHGSGQMLWEWRPPFLEHRSTPQLDARPFVSVVRLPVAVKNQISAHVAKASGSSDEMDAKLDDVMTTLGTRGIGLSSLMAQGGTHAAGAVGFYLTLRLLERATVEGAQLLVLPIDACDEFLRVLANESATTNQLRRADLLLVAVAASGVTLVPVEIKCYGLGSASPQETLPGTAAQLAGALSQLESTSELLDQVVESYRQLIGLAPAEAALWRHGFTTMVEAAMRLRPASTSGAELLGATLSGLLEGDVNVRLGRSMLCYFGHEAVTADGSTHAIRLGLEAPVNAENRMAGALICNTQVAFDFVHKAADSIESDWQKLVEWVLADDAEGDTKPIRPEPPSRADSEPDFSAGDAVSDLSKVGASGERPIDEPKTSNRLEPEPEGDLEVPMNVAPLPAYQSIEADGVRFEMGRTIDGVGAHRVDFWPSNTALNQMNLGVVGDLGTGKTQFLKSVVYQLRKCAADRQPTPLSMLIFDYKRDYHDAEFLASVGGQLQRPYHIPLNVLAIDGEYTPQKAVQAGGAFVDIITKIYGGIGPVQKSKVLMIIKDLFAQKGGSAPTLGEVLEAYLEENSFDSVAAVLNGFVLNEVFSEDRSELITMEEMLHNKVLVLAVSDLGADDNLKTALITLFLNKYYEHMLRLKKWPYEGEAPNQLRRLNSFVMVDEATNIMAHEFPVLSQLLLQGREFGVGVILASQYVSHFKVGKTNYGETLLTKVVHKVPNTNATDLKAFGFSSATPDMAAKVPNLAVHQALVKTFGVEARFMRGTPYFELDIERPE